MIRGIVKELHLLFQIKIRYTIINRISNWINIPYDKFVIICRYLHFPD